MKIKILLVFFGFLSYWSATIFFTMPENYLQIKALPYGKVFHTIFYQQWSFFAPPPQHNERLYYEFVNTEKQDTLLLEVLEPMQKKMREKFLSNDEESFIDYILSGSITNVTDAMSEQFRSYKFSECKEATEDECYDAFIEKFDAHLYDLNALNTLKNYGLILNRSRTNKQYNKFKIIGSQIMIKKFADREKEDVLLDEEFTLETKYYDINKKTWKK